MKKNQAIMAIAFFTFLLFSNTLQNAFTVDDDLFVLQNKFVTDFQVGNMFTKGSLVGYDGQTGEQPYRPVTLLTLGIEYAMWGAKASGFHLVSILLFIGIAVLLFKLLQKIFSENIFLSFILTLLFVAHPIHTEVVDNIKSQDELLSLFFSLFSLNLFWDYLKDKKTKHLFLSIGLFFMALLSKESAIANLALFPLVSYFFGKKSVKNALTDGLFYFVPALFYLIIRFNVIVPDSRKTTKDVYDNVVNLTTNLSETIGTKLLILGYHIKMLLLPYPLSWDYSPNQIEVTPITNVYALLSLACYIFLGYLVVKGFKNRNVLSFSILVFFATILITSNLLFPGGASFAERFLFTPSVALIVAIGYLLTKYGKNKWNTSLMIVGGLILLSSFITFQRNTDWKDNLSLFEASVKSAPKSNRNYMALGFELYNIGRKQANPVAKQEYLNRAVGNFQKSIDISPTNYYAMEGLGKTLWELGRKDEAVASFKQAIAAKPIYPYPYDYVFLYYLDKSDFSEAEKYVSKRLNLNPNNTDALSNMGVFYQRQSKFEEAKGYFRQALTVNPNNQTARQNLKMIEDYEREIQRQNVQQINK